MKISGKTSSQSCSLRFAQPLDEIFRLNCVVFRLSTFDLDYIMECYLCRSSEFDGRQSSFFSKLCLWSIAVSVGPRQTVITRTFVFKLC